MKKFAIAIHAGAETVKREDISKEQETQYREGLQEALAAGNAVLEKGGSALDAVVAAIEKMENNPLFNAGIGGNLNIHGETAFDAAIMDGKNLKSGSVGSIRYVKNPIKLARVVMEKCRHNFMVDTGAEEFALSQGLELKPPSHFVTEEKLKSWHQNYYDDYLKGHDTVGAVALDQNGNLAAATSTGGLNSQLKGRLSDSPLIGAGTYANNPYCAVSCTGKGEVIMRGVLAHEVYALVKYAGEGLQTASEKAVTMHKALLDGDMGLVSLNQQQEVAFAFNTNMMKRGYSLGGAAPLVALWDNEHI
ncbi:isoaspartyl peptidase/L-asparaginase family protein [Pontibacter actiniarum]|uniref:Isoaspartyl peptidase n=1 Tax=Pontibacter actiniarum TaxID=323450 RepID=A0A1X9YP78_9BACT|nr:isoaspartyl peptidase/L-asparaginase [Pontibacter actiniarum]ARS34698.1 isoaspartyl peptidase/L-asparaginase [Pontibacter actiniarum]